MQMIAVSRGSALDLGLVRYFTGKECKNGHVAERFVSNRCCVVCEAEKQRKDNMSDIEIERSKAYSRKYYNKNKERINDEIRLRMKNDDEFRDKKRASDRRYREKNIEKIRKYDRERLSKNKELKYAYFSARRKERRDQINEYMRKYKKINRKTSYWGIADIYRSVVRRAINASESIKQSKTELITGYGVEKFISRIEYTFKDGMSWENHGDWHVDHIIPVSYFLKKGVTSQRVINSLCNLRAMWAIDNMRKNDKHPFKDMKYGK